MSLLSQSYYRVCATRPGRWAACAALGGLRRAGVLRQFSMPLDALQLPPDAVAGLMRLWRRMHWSSGDGMMPPEQLLALYRWAALWPAEGDIVELGAWVGLTTCYLATACRVRGAGRIYAVDTFAGTKEGGEPYRSVSRYAGNTLHEFKNRVRRARVADLVEPLVGTTAEVAGRYPGGPIRLLLIDADHSYHGVKNDYRLWSPLVADGGLIVFHDTLMPEVARFVDEVVGSDPQIDPSPGDIVSNIIAVTKGR